MSERVGQSVFQWFVRHTWFGPAALAALFMALLGGLLWMMETRALANQRSDLADHASAAEAAIRKRLTANRDFMLALAEQMPLDAPDSERLERRINAYLADHPELLSIAMVGPDRVIRWIVPRATHEQLIGTELSLPDPASAFERARQAEAFVHSSPFIDLTGATVFELFVPVMRDGRFEGALSAAHSCNNLLWQCIRRETYVRHHVTLTDVAGNVIVELPTLGDADERLIHTAPLSAPGVGLRLRLQRYGKGFWAWGQTLLVVLCVGLVLGMAWGMWLLNRHIQQRTAAEEALRRASEELERRVRERTADLELEMAERQNAEERLRQHQDQLTHVARLSTMGEMAAGLAHELHQPLGAIAGYAEGGLLLLDREKDSRDELRRALSEMSTQAQRAGRIIHRLRDFVSDRSSPKTTEDLRTLVDEVVELMEIEARQHGVAIETDLPSKLPPVLVDRIQIQQVLLNLIRNAMEAMQSSNGREQVVRVTAGRGGDDRIEIAVRDSGPGCEPAHRQQMFDAFFTTKPQGMGMGLSICRTIIESHHGRLWPSDNKAGRGLTMRFTLPLAEQQETDA